jgi:hypothetical protein
VLKCGGWIAQSRTAHHLPLGIYSLCVAGAAERPKIANYTITPEEGMMKVGYFAAGQISLAHDLASIIDPKWKRIVTSERA